MGSVRATSYHPVMPRQRKGPAHSFHDDRRGDRIQKVLSAAGVASRRDCEAMVLEGRVTVNGEILDGLPAWVDASKDRVEVDGRPIRRHGVQEMVYIMLFKPKGIVCTNDDPEGRRRAVDLVDHPSKLRVFPVGRLEMDASGLLLLTNDGELANRLTHPRFEVPQAYEVTVGGRLDEVAVKRLSESLFARQRSDSAVTRSSLKLLGRESTKTTLLMELKDGRSPNVRAMLLRLKHPVRRLRRVGIGPLRLRGLGVGAWRELTSSELAQLRESAFQPPAKRAKPDERGAPPKKTPAGGKRR